MLRVRLRPLANVYRSAGKKSKVSNKRELSPEDQAAFDNQMKFYKQRRADAMMEADLEYMRHQKGLQHGFENPGVYNFVSFLFSTA